MAARRSPARSCRRSAWAWSTSQRELSVDKNSQPARPPVLDRGARRCARTRLARTRIARPRIAQLVPALALALVLGACSSGAGQQDTAAPSGATAPATSAAEAPDADTPAPEAEPPPAALDTEAPDPAPAGAPSPSADAALAQLSTLAVKGRAPKTGYSRDQFGPAWTDAVSVEGGRNGCDTRNDILRRDLTDLTFKPGSKNCAVLTGVLHDPYTGTVIAFQRGAGTSSEVQIDHMVALISDRELLGAKI